MSTEKSRDIEPSWEGSLAGLKVAYIAFEPFPNQKGSGTRIRNLLAGLLSAGAEVWLITLGAKPGAGSGLSGVHHRPLKILENNFLKRGVAFRERVLRELVSIKPDIIHFRGVFEGEAALAYARSYPVRTVFEVNGLPSVELPYHYRELSKAPELLGKFRALEGRLLASVGFGLTQSETTLAFLRDRGFPLNKEALVLPNAADPMLFEQRPLEQPSAPRLLYVGAAQGWQGVLELLLIQRRLLKVRPAILSLVGPLRRSWRKQLEARVARLKLKDHVELCGALTPEELAEQIAASQVCLAPLRSDVRNKNQGCSPIKLYEYMSVGRPVIATDLGCIREIIRHEETGVLLDAPKPKLWADAIAELLTDPPRQRALSNAAGQYVRAQATWRMRREALLSFYRDRVLR